MANQRYDVYNFYRSYPNEAGRTQYIKMSAVSKEDAIKKARYSLSSLCKAVDTKAARLPNGDYYVRQVYAWNF